MADQVDLHEARLALVPRGKGADRDLMFEQGSGLGAGASAQRPFATLRSQ